MFVPVEIIKPPHLVGTVVRTVAGADAPIVRHDVQTLGIMHGGIHRADHLAGGQLTLLAGHRFEGDLGVLGNLTVAIAAKGPGRDAPIGIIPVDADPVHLAAADHLVPADDRNVVLRLAGDDAGLAAGAGVEVDRHSPLVQTVEFGRRIEGIAARDLRRLFRQRLFRGFLVVGRTVRLEADRRDECRVALELVDIGLANDLAALHRPVLLGVGEGLPRAGDDLDRRAHGERQRVAGPQ